MARRVEKSDEQWRAELAPDQYAVLRQAGTERPGTGKLLHETRSGAFTCAGCGTEIFSSDRKFDSGSGWPSFTDPLDGERLTLHEDVSLGMRRVEVRCATCDGHLGHVFPDGPGESGERYCINSCALEFRPEG